MVVEADPFLFSGYPHSSTNTHQCKHKWNKAVVKESSYLVTVHAFVIVQALLCFSTATSFFSVRDLAKLNFKLISYIINCVRGNVENKSISSFKTQLVPMILECDRGKLWLSYALCLPLKAKEQQHQQQTNNSRWHGILSIHIMNVKFDRGHHQCELLSCFKKCYTSSS